MSENFTHEDLIKTKITYPSLFKRLWPYAKKEKSFCYSRHLCGHWRSHCRATCAALIGYAIDHGIKGKTYEVFTKLLYLFDSGNFPLLFFLRECVTCFNALEIECSFICAKI